MQNLIFQLLFCVIERLIEFIKIVGKHVRLRYEVKVVLDVSLLLLLNVHYHVVFPRQFNRNWEMVDFLSFLHPLVEIALSGGVGPQNVPIVSVG